MLGCFPHRSVSWLFRSQSGPFSLLKSPHVPVHSETHLPSGATLSFRYSVRSPCQSHTLLPLSWAFPVLESIRGLAVLCKRKLPHVSNMWNKGDERGPKGRVSAHMASLRDVGAYTASPAPSQENHKQSQQRTREWVNKGLPDGQAHTLYTKSKRSRGYS